MNALTLLKENNVNLEKMAFFSLSENSLRHSVSFADLFEIAAKTQSNLESLPLQLQEGDSVLLADNISPELYGVVLGMLGLGVTIIFVEPFLPVSEIDSVIQQLKPKLFVASMLGQCWGARVAAIRRIPNWQRLRSVVRSASPSQFKIKSVSSQTAGIITFTSGTTGKSKGVVRTHEGLIQQNQIIDRAANFSAYQDSPDLAIFANLVLANLAMGRGSIFISPKWKISDFKKLEKLSEILEPGTLSCGPAFLSRVLSQVHLELPSLKSIHVGGALTDCQTFESAFQKWPSARFIHVYGSSEAEPVAVSDARIAVSESIKRNYFQTLHLGTTIPEIDSKIEEGGDRPGLWVTGPHVGKYYIGNEEENMSSKRTDDQNRVWHFMGDRITKDDTGFWYQGRSQQNRDDFELEQKIYCRLKSSAAFVHTSSVTGKKFLIGENLMREKNKIMRDFPIIQDVFEKKIIRDRRHRARIDRTKTVQTLGKKFRKEAA